MAPNWCRVAFFDRLKPAVRDPRKASWFGAFLTIVGVPAAVAAATYFVVKAELQTPVATTASTKYVQADGPFLMPVTCRGPTGCFVSATYRQLPPQGNVKKQLMKARGRGTSAGP